MLTPDPTDEQLARDWTLSEKDRIEVRRARRFAWICAALSESTIETAVVQCV